MHCVHDLARHSLAREAAAIMYPASCHRSPFVQESYHSTTMSSTLSSTLREDVVCTSNGEIRSAAANGNAANWCAVLAARRTARSTCFFQPTVDESKILQSWLRENLAAKPWSILVEEVTGRSMPDRLGASASGQVPAQPTRIGVYPYSSETDSRVWKLSMPQSAVNCDCSLPTKPGPAGDWDSMCSTAAPADGESASYRGRGGGVAPLATQKSHNVASCPVSGTWRAGMSSNCAITPHRDPPGNAIGEAADPLDPTDSGFDRRERNNEQSGSENDSTDSSSGGGGTRGARRIDSSQLVGSNSTSTPRGESPLGMASGSSAASVYYHGAASRASNIMGSVCVSHARGNSTGGASELAGCQRAAGGAPAVMKDLRGPGVKFQAIGVTGQWSAGRSGAAAAAAASSMGAPPAIAEPNEACWLRLRRTWAHRAAVRQAHAFGRCMSDSCGAAKYPVFKEDREAVYSRMQYIRLPDAYTASRPSELKLTIGRARYGHKHAVFQAGKLYRRARAKAGHASSERRRRVPRHSHGHGSGRAPSHVHATHAHAGAGGCPTLPMYRPVRRVTFMESNTEVQEHASGPASAASNGSSPAGPCTPATVSSSATFEGSSPMEGQSGRTRSWRYGQGRPGATDPLSGSVCSRNRGLVKPAQSSTERTRWTSSGSVSSSSIQGGAALKDVKERSSEWAKMETNEATVKGGKDSVTVSPLFMLNGLSEDQVALLEGGMPLMEEVLGLSGLVLVVLKQG